MLSTVDIYLRLSTAQRDCLIEHADGPLPFEAHTPHDLNLRRTKECLLEQDLLCLTRSDIASNTSRPQTLELTRPHGVHVACFIMAQYAEALIRAGGLKQRTADEVMKDVAQMMAPTIFDDLPVDYENNVVRKNIRSTYALLALLKATHSPPPPAS